MTLRALAIGASAAAALARAAGEVRVMARLGASTYGTAAGEIVWLGAADSTLHPRAILTTTARVDDDVVRVDAGGLAPWTPPAPGRASIERLVSGWRGLAGRAATLGAVGGFGVLLTGAPLAFPLDGAGAAVRAMACAARDDDAPAAAEVAPSLLGLGGGLTPSGDDFTGGVFFARGLLAAAGGADAEAWRHAGEAVIGAAHARTHPISVALLGDLIAGAAWASLHEMIAALASGTGPAAEAAARRLVRLGHTSGWDVLAGVGAGLGALDV